MSNFLLVCAGGALGAGARYLVYLGALRWLGTGFPWGTLTVNLVGSFLMGILAQWILMRSGWPVSLRMFLMTGILGGFTTFSAFSLDVAVLTEKGEFASAALYMVASIAGAIAALFAGQWFMRLWLT